MTCSGTNTVTPVSLELATLGGYSLDSSKCTPSRAVEEQSLSASPPLHLIRQSSQIRDEC